MVGGVEMTACADGKGGVTLRSHLELEPRAACTKWTLQGTTDASYGLQSWVTKQWLVSSVGTGDVSVTASSYLHPEGGSIAEGRWAVEQGARFWVTERQAPGYGSVAGAFNNA